MARAGNRLYYKQNRLKQLRAFCCAAQTGSISKAAERLDLSQPSVTLQIQALERELNVTLFERRGPKIQLTPDGRNFYQIAQPLLHGVDTLSEVFAASSGNLTSGELSIAAGESTLLYLLPDFIKRFTNKYPGIRIKLQNVTGRDGLALLRADDADFAVGSFIEIPDDITYRPVFHYDPMLIVPLEHPLARKKNLKLEDISPFGLILPPRHLSTWRVVDTVFRQHDLDYKVTLEAGGWEIVKKYVELGLGVSIVTSICLTGREKLAAIPLDRYFPRRSYGVVLRRGKFITPQARLFIEMMDPDFFTRSAETAPRSKRKVS